MFIGTTGKLLADSGVAAASVVVGPASATSGNLASYNGTTGKLIADGGKAVALVVLGPSSATDNAVVRFDSTTGRLIQNSVVIIGDTGVVTGITDITANQFLSANFLYVFLNNGFASNLTCATQTSDKTWTLPDTTGTIALTSQIASNPVTAAAVIADNRLVRGDGGARGVQDSGITIDDSNNVGGVANLTTTGNTTLGDASGDSCAINSAAPHMDNLAAPADPINAIVGWRSGLLSAASSSDILDFLGLAPPVCPFVYITVAGERIHLGDIIPNRRSPELAGVDLLQLPKVNYFTVAEEKEETSYIQRLAVVVNVLNGEDVVIDFLEAPIVMNTGDVLNFEFEMPDNATSIWLLSKGYYIPHPKATDSPKKEET